MSHVYAMAVFLCLTLLLTGCEIGGSSAAEPDGGAGMVNDPPAPPNAPEDDNGGAEDDHSDATDQGFAVANHFPQVDDDNIALVTQISVTFNQPLLEQSFSGDLLQVMLDGAPIRGVQQRVDARTLKFVPETLLRPDGTYQVIVSDQAMSQSGQVLTPREWQFQTVADVYSTSQDIIDQCMSAQDIEMLASVNSARIQSRNCGDTFRAPVGRLSWNCTLQQAAINHAVDMSSQNFFSHTGSDGSSAGDRATRVGYDWGRIGENIAAGQSSVPQVMTGWLNSPGHCLNIMSPHYSEFGFGYSTNNNSDYRRYWAQMFGAPRSRR